MKHFLIVFLLTSSAFGANVITNPSISTDNVITSTGNIQALTVTGVGASLAAALFINYSGYDALQGLSSDGAGVYGYSDHFTGIYGGSATGNAGYFQSSASSNSSATVLIQVLGGSANLLEFQSDTGTRLSSVDSAGSIHASAGLQLDTTASLPTCNSTSRGEMYVVRGGSGVADILKICMKDAANAYSWIIK